jgi:hypothetical protein
MAEKTVILEYQLKDKSNERVMDELGADKIIHRDGQFVIYK